ncbi:MAG: branched-chain amino acid ABC transporter permease [Thermodesulfobacteriota bacterium]|jgi:branched-chain amino acid transport system permease protein
MEKAEAKRGKWWFSGWQKRIVFFIFLALFPLLLHDPVFIHVLVISCLFGMMGIAWSLIAGYTGQFSLGHCVFFGVGAYTSTILYMKYNLSPWIGMFLGALIAVLVALTVGYICLTLRGPFFALATMAVAELFRIFAIYLKNLTGGSIGLLMHFQPNFVNFIFRDKNSYLWIILSLTVIFYYVTRSITHGRIGYYLIAIREDEDAAKMLGINTMRYKATALAISAFITAIGGTFYAQYILYISPYEIFSFDISIQLAFVSILGGMGTLTGPILGSLLITPLNEFLRATLGEYQSLYLVFYGIVMIIIVIMMPEGLLNWLKILSKKVLFKRANAPQNI